MVSLSDTIENILRVSGIDYTITNDKEKVNESVERLKRQFAELGLDSDNTQRGKHD